MNGTVYIEKEGNTVIIASAAMSQSCDFFRWIDCNGKKYSKAESHMLRFIRTIQLAH